MNDSRRLLQIDGLRALAALSVVAYHYTTRYQEVFPDAAPLFAGFAHGNLGVNLFFAISGFVIVMTLERSRSAFQFVSSRVARLYPAYWGAIALTTCALLLLPLPWHDRMPSATQVLVNLTMLQRFVGIRDVDGAYWSLQIELIFYVWMLAMWRLGALRRPVRLCLAWTAAVLLTKVVERQSGIRLDPDWSNALMLYWFPWFAIGVLSWDGLRTKATATAADKVAQTGSSSSRIRLVALGFAILTASWGEGLSILACALAAALLLHAAARQQLPALQWRPLVFFGAISYPLYLLHQSIGWTLIRHLGDHTTAARVFSIAVAVGVSVTLATLVHRWLEEPGRLRLRAWAQVRIP